MVIKIISHAFGINKAIYKEKCLRVKMLVYVIHQQNFTKVNS